MIGRLVRAVAQRYCGHNDIVELERRMHNIQVDTRKTLKTEKKKAKRA